MPWTAGLFALGAVAISGLPPLNGFVSEWLVYLGLFDATLSRGPSAWAAIPAAILLGMTGALGAGVFCQSVRRGLPGRSPLEGGGTRARMRADNAWRDARFGRSVRGHRPGALPFLACRSRKRWERGVRRGLVRKRLRP